MCGIGRTRRTGERAAAPHRGAQALGYRGCDSAGLGFYNRHEIELFKTKNRARGPVDILPILACPALRSPETAAWTGNLAKSVTVE